MVNYWRKKTLLFLGFKYGSNLLSHCINLLSFQGKFDVINIPMAILTKMAVNYHGICFITLAPGCNLAMRLIESYYLILIGAILIIEIWNYNNWSDQFK